jgi:hypothetical protein
MGYELFASKGVRRLNDPAIGITKMGRVNINKAALQILRSKKTEYVLLYWDKDKHKIGIKPSKKDARAYQVNTNSKENNAGFHGGLFVKHIGFDNSVNRLMFAEWNEKEGMLEIDVPQEFLKSDTNEAGKTTKRVSLKDDGG